MNVVSVPGIISYQGGLDRMESLWSDRVADRIDDTLLFLEHEPVITVGRGATPREGEVSVSRGGAATWHGPGQLVMYPIVKLGAGGLTARRDVVGFLRTLEQVVCLGLSQLCEVADDEFRIRPGLTGVWTSQQKKVASIGINVRHWVTTHGVAINVTNVLDGFHSISPCGLDPSAISRLCDHWKMPEDWRSKLEAILTNQFLRRGIESPAVGVMAASRSRLVRTRLTPSSS